MTRDILYKKSRWTGRGAARGGDAVGQSYLVALFRSVREGAQGLGREEA